MKIIKFINPSQYNIAYGNNQIQTQFVLAIPFYIFYILDPMQTILRKDIGLLGQKNSRFGEN